MDLNVEQMFEIVVMYGECRRNAQATANMYNARFVNARPVERRQVTSIVTRLRETGELQPRRRGGRRRVATNAQTEARVLETVNNNPHTSSRAIGADLGVSHQSVLRVLHRHKYHPFHIHLHQAMEGRDPPRRLEFCNWLDVQIDDNPRFLESILWSDEASFSRDANVNTHNCHYWSVENPHWLRQVNHQYQFRLNVWCGILNNRIIGPVFLPQHLNGQRYLQMLQEYLENILDELPLAMRRSLWFQQDGAPAHFLLAVRNYLDEHFPDHWIGRGGPVPWPPRSPDLTPLDFFFWGVIKEKVYTSQPTDIEDLRNRIINACQTITPIMLSSVRANIQKRVQLCIAAEGAHIEHFI